MSKVKARIAHVSDIHLFHARNPTTDIIAKLDKYVLGLSKKDIDLLLFAGDIFDNLANLSNESVWPVFDFAARLCKWAESNRVPVRILKGTPRHDWNQNLIFETVARQKGCSWVVLKNTLELEYIEHLDLRLLYIPDEYKPLCAQVYRDVQQLLDDAGIDQVDVVCMHGAFEHQVPSMNVHLKVDYERICRGFITAGHVHKYTAVGKVIAQGSFDRLSHGEEEDKGFNITSLYQDGSFKTVRVVNELAMQFKSVDVVGLLPEDALALVRSTAAKLPAGSYIRIVASKEQPIFESIKAFRGQWPLLQWSKKEVSTQAKLAFEQTDLLVAERLIELTRDNISEILVAKALSLSSDYVDEAKLKELLEPYL